MTRCAKTEGASSNRRLFTVDAVAGGGWTTGGASLLATLTRGVNTGVDRVGFLSTADRVVG